MLLGTGFSPLNSSHTLGYPIPMVGHNPMMVYFQQLMQAIAGLMGAFQGGYSQAAGLPMVSNFGTTSLASSSGLSDFLGGPNLQPASNAPARPSKSRSGDDKFTTLNVNIKSRPAMPQKAVLHDVKKAAANADLIGWNEISLPRYREAIKSLGPEWGHYMPKDGKYKISNPISYRKDEWKMEKGGFLKTHEGKAGIVPDRYITWAKLNHRGSGEKIVRINTHTVPGAFNKKSSHNAWRRSAWNTHMSKLSNMVKKFEKQGYKVVIGGDFNKDSSKVLGNQVNYANGLHKPTTDGGSTLDYLMHTRDPGLKNLSGGVLGGFRSDHHAVLGTYRLR